MDERLLVNYDELVTQRERKPLSIGNVAVYELANVDDSRDSLSSNPRYAEPTPELTTYGNIKLGWIQGVLIPCLLNIWGVMLFLRIAWIVAQAGIAVTIAIIVVSFIVCVITTLSLSAICTNGELHGGGVYYIVSRSLGAELGASVGIIFAFANAVAASMNTIGFCESLNELLKSNSLIIIDNGPHDTRIIGAIALLVMCIICAVGMDWETKTQNFLMVIIIAAIVNFVIGAAIGPTTDEKKARGFVGLNLEIAQENLLPDYRVSDGKEYDLFRVFSIFFPAITGVQAGANICGDLKDPATAIPKGTLIALAISVTSYLAMATLSGMGAVRDASGNISDVANNTLQNCKPNCNYGLHNNNEIMQMMALWGPLIYVGCWAATLSTALTNLLSVPRLIQALGFDRLYPGLIFFSKPYGKHGEPFRGYVLAFFVSLLFLLIADLNTIAPLISNFYLASYALINFCTFHAAFFQAISWRPRFRFYNTWVSLAGFLMCLVIMVVISWIMALITTFIFITLYLLVLYRKPDTSWGSSTEAQRYQETIASIVHMYHREANTKLFNPQLLVLAGKPDERPWLTDLGALITKVGSFMILADIESVRLTQRERHNRRLAGEEWLRQRKMRAFYVLVQGCTFEQGCQALLQTTGLGRIAPNVVLLGYKYDWDTCAHAELLTYYHMIRLAFKFELAMAILCVPTNFRPYKRAGQSPSSTERSSTNSASALARERIRVVTLMSSDSEVDLHRTMAQQILKSALSRAILSTGVSQTTLSTKRSSRSEGPPLRKVGAYKTLSFSHNSILDAWWLYDDGGMNILLPYIIARRGSKEKMSLRIFALPQRGMSIKAAEEEMESLLRKFRIDYSQLTMITGIRDKPDASTWAFFNNVTNKHMTTNNDDILISDEELTKLNDRICRHLRLRELLIENSFGADFIVMTLPLPRQGISAAMYMAWLKVMSQDMPPILFVRGNSTVVIE
ncbi:hypothetical protein PYW08_002808 [Mythimna loreyi]|uniref:Uncharacterized protein n=1 Tax=Mythimna loreyi TaxID=667449 RepID=A0ACC2QJ27_9NEOP|nr:hypothetical protein PYW08_002808 [Mythimna loreyi]